MKFAALISGGKDSLYCLMQSIAAGHELVALANLSPCGKDELDSYMYQTVGHMGISAISKALDVTLFQREIKGKSVNIENLHYEPTEEDEVEDLFLLLHDIRESCGIEAISCGAILSNYQRNRVENVCSRLGLVSLSYLWERDQVELLQEMLDSKMDVIVIKVATIGLEPSKHLGKTLQQLQPHLMAMKKKYLINVCGEGGEYETFTLDCPVFKKRILIDEFKTVELSGDVGYLNFKSIRLEDKPGYDLPLHQLVEKAKIKSPKCYLESILNSLSLETDFHSIEENFSLENETSQATSSFVRAVSYANDMTAAINEIKVKLGTKGVTLKDIIYVKLFVKNMQDYPKYNSEYIKYFSFNPPARTCVQTQMHIPGNISLEAIAWSDDLKANEKIHLHVQSVSHWAPANIGPYSQGVKVAGTVMLAGMIGLISGEMKLVQEENQARLSFAHVNRVVSVLAPRQGVETILQAVCYVTTSEAIPIAKAVVSGCITTMLTCYIVVPALPKNALVEWQTWGHRLNANFVFCEYTITVGNYDVIFRRRYLTGTTTSGSIIEIHCINESTDTDDLANISTAIYSRINTGWTTHLSVFYRREKIASSLLKMHMESVGFCEPLFVPVEALEQESIVAVIVAAVF